MILHLTTCEITTCLGFAGKPVQARRQSLPSTTLMVKTRALLRAHSVLPGQHNNGCSCHP
eukprot:1158758-Pelagomonas_calceolata.AAC.11